VERRGTVAGQRDHAHARMVVPQPCDRADAVEARHMEVDHHRVGRELVGELDRCEAVVGPPHHGELRLSLDQRRERLEERPVVVGKENPDHGCRFGIPHPAGS